MIESTFVAPVDGAGSQHIVHPRSAVSWPAVIAGAFVAIAASLILIALGSGIGFASISPWADHGVSATTFTVTSIIWLIVTQWVSAGLGGYIAGRLRTRWVATHTHEVFFRDTAHGLLTWSVATVLLVGFLGSSLFSAAGVGVHAASDVAAGVAKGALMSATSPSGTYEIDRLFRATDPSSAPTDSVPRQQVAGILANAAVSGEMPASDRAYLTQLVAAWTGASPADAQRRVDDFTARVNDLQVNAKAVADSARKVAAELSIYLALSLLIGAFIASVAAALGGRLRDEHP